MMKRSLFLLCLGCILPFCAKAYATVGVGVGTGKIEISEKLKPGMIYDLPSLTVVNTGDEASDYEVSIAYHQDQIQIAPPEQWFSFSPATFHLEPGKTQVVEVKLNLPLKMTPGDYFAYLEGHPAKRSNIGNATVGVAAAAKLYFSVAPASFLHSVYYRVVSLWKTSQPWSSRVVCLAVVLTVLLIAKKYVKIQINLKNSTTSAKNKTNE